MSRFIIKGMRYGILNNFLDTLNVQFLLFSACTRLFDVDCLLNLLRSDSSKMEINVKLEQSDDEPKTQYLTTIMKCYYIILYICSSMA